MIVAVIAFGVIAYVIYIAPALLAELMLDAGITAGLYQHLRRNQGGDWFSTALRKTVMPALIVAGLLMTAGLIMEDVYPGAHSVGVVVHRAVAHQRAR